jgi:O-antigen/teichoic acid export membrane protein
MTDTKPTGSFLRHAAVYGLAEVLMQAGNLVLVPLYVRFLTQAGFGTRELLGRAAELVGACVLAGGLRQGLITFHQQSGSEAGRRRVVCAALALAASCCLLGGGLVLLLAGPLTGWLDPGMDPVLLRLAVLAVLLEPLAQMPLALLQARLESTAFVAVSVSQFLSRIALTVLFVAGFGWGVFGAFGATALNGAIYGLGLGLRELRRGVVWPGWGDLRRMFAFAVPFLPGALCFFVLQHGDRFFLLRCRGPEEVATYSLGYLLAGAVGAFTLQPLYRVWGSQLYAAARGPDAPRVFGVVFTRVLACYLFVGLGLALLADEAVWILAGGTYAASVPIVAPVLLGGLCQSAASLMDAAFYVRRRTGLKLRVTLVVTAVMLALYALLIPWAGSMGAALATLGGFACLAAFTFLTTQRIFPVRYEWPRLLALLASAAGLWLLGRLAPAEEPWGAVVRGGLWLLWPALLWFAGVVSAEEKAQARSLFRRLFALLRPPRMADARADVETPTAA